MAFKRVVIGVVVVVTALALTFAVAPAQDKKGTGKDAGKAAVVFEVYKDKGGEFRFRIKNDEGDILAITQKSYEKKEDLLKIIDTIKKNAATAKVDDQSTKK